MFVLDERPQLGGRVFTEQQRSDPLFLPYLNDLIEPTSYEERGSLETVSGPPADLHGLTPDRVSSKSRRRFQRIVTNVVDSVLCTDLTDLEPQEEDTPRILYYKPMSWLGVITKFKMDDLGDHVSACTTHSGVKMTHDWVVEEVAELFSNNEKVDLLWEKGHLVLADFFTS